MRGCIEPEVSTARPIESGRLFTCSNFAIFTGLPSSRTLNAFCGEVVDRMAVANDRRRQLDEVNVDLFHVTAAC